MCICVKKLFVVFHRTNTRPERNYSKLSIGEIWLANFIPPANGASQGSYLDLDLISFFIYIIQNVVIFNLSMFSTNSS